MNIGRSLSNNLSKLVLLLVSGFCIFYAIAFVRLYFMEHPYRVASRWMYEHIPQGSRIIGPHWDDRVPVGLPGFSGSRYQMEGRNNEFPVYEQDTERLIDLLTLRLSETDYIAFATPRAIDSIPRIPDEYPNTTALLRLLWGEKLGFTFVYSTKNRPNLFGVTFNDDLADESFSVYDHPKVVVFQNTDRLSKEELKNRIAHVDRFEPLPSMNEMLLMDSGGWKPTPTLWQPGWTTYLLVVVVVLALGFCFYVMVAPLLGMRLSRLIIGLSPIGGVVLVGSLLVLGEWVGIVGFTKQGTLAVSAILLVVSFVRIASSSKGRSRSFSVLRDGGGACAVTIVLGGCLALLMLSAREAPIGISDYVEQAYFLSIIRSDVFPNTDLFASEDLFRFSNIGRFLLGVVLKIAGASLPYAVTAAYVAAGSILAGVLFAVLSLVSRSHKIIAGASIFCLIPTLYIGFVQCDKANAAIAAEYSLADAERFVRLGHWMASEVSGTPPVAVRCEERSPLPFSGSLAVKGGRELGGALCSLNNPDELYQELMKLGAEFYVIDTSARQGHEEVLAALDSRQDLVMRAYERDSLVVYTPAFSAFYARHARQS